MSSLRVTSFEQDCTRLREDPNMRGKQRRPRTSGTALAACVAGAIGVFVGVSPATWVSHTPGPQRRLFVQPLLLPVRASKIRHGERGIAVNAWTLLAGFAVAASAGSCLLRGHSTASWAKRHVVTVANAACHTGSSLQLFAPAKINLFLRVLRRRPDGYHDLASLFHTVSFGDTLGIELLTATAGRDQLSCNLKDVPLDESNLVAQAFKLFRQKSGLQHFFRAHLEKRVPMQAGMGGGSSNAAAAFFGANKLCGSPASPVELLRWADDPIMGSDASFFLSEGTAYCTGRGEIVTPVAPLPLSPGQIVYLVKPKLGLSTPKVFKALDLANVSKDDPEELLRTFQQKGILHSCWVNDLELPAFKVSPELGQLKDFLLGERFGFQAVLMSGSGSTIYCLGKPKDGFETFEAATRQKFSIEGIWQTSLIRRQSLTEWYSI